MRWHVLPPTAVALTEIRVHLWKFDHDPGAIGSGIIINGALYRRTNDMAGEIDWCVPRDWARSAITKQDRSGWAGS